MESNSVPNREVAFSSRAAVPSALSRSTHHRHIQAAISNSSSAASRMEVIPRHRLTAVKKLGTI